MIRWLRRKLWEFRYYSASREHTGWTRAADAALLAAFIGAVPMTWFFDSNMPRFDTRYTITGQLQQLDDGSFHATVTGSKERATDLNIPIEQLYGFYDISAERVERGLPLTTSYLTQKPTIEVREYHNVQQIADVDVSAGSPLRIAIEDVLRRTNDEQAGPLLALLAADSYEFQPVYGAWLAGSFVWMIALFVGFSLLLVLARIGYIVLGRHQASLQAALIAAGKCPNCRYDLRGLEFSDRCPECGELQE